MSTTEGPDVVDRVWMWMGQPDVGRESLLMVALANQGPDGSSVVYRAMVTESADQALDWSTMAYDAGTALGVKAVLREFVRVTPGGTT